MAKLIEYDQVETLKDEDVFLIDGPALQNPEGVVQVENELIDALMNAA